MGCLVITMIIKEQALLQSLLALLGIHDGVYVGVSQALSAGSVDYSAAAVHYLDLRLLRVLSWFCILKQVWETVNRLIIWLVS
jgi:hypothetical protein